MGEDKNSRNFPRYPCEGAAEIYQHGTRCGWGTVTEIGRGGCYVETGQPLAAGTAVNVRLTIAGRAFETAAVIAWNTPQVGMGIRFEPASAEDASQLAEFVQRATGKAQPANEVSCASAAKVAFNNSGKMDQGSNGQVGAPISPEAALRILARIVQRVRQTGALTEQELLEIVNANR